MEQTKTKRKDWKEMRTGRRGRKEGRRERIKIYKLKKKIIIKERQELGTTKGRRIGEGRKI